MMTPVTNIRPMRPQTEVSYNKPSLEELVQLCVDFELITEIISLDGRFHMLCKDEKFVVTPAEAEFLVRGLLIGPVAFHTRDALSLANWLN